MSIPSGFTNNGAIKTQPGFLGRLFGVPNKFSQPTTSPTPQVQPPSVPKIGTNQGLINPQPKTAVKSTSVAHPDGTTVTHTFQPEATPTPPTATPPTPPVPTTPQVGDTKQNYQGLLNTGNLTPLEEQSRNSLTQAGQMTPQESIANENVAKANQELKAYQNVQSLSPYAEATMYGDRARTPAEIQTLEQAPDLAGRASATNGLLGSLGNIYGTADVAGANAALQGIQTAAGRGLTAAGTNLGAAQNQASRAAGAAGTVAGASLPGQLSGSSRLFNPLAPIGQNSSVESGANNQSKYDLLNQYNTGKVKLNAATGIESQILNTLQSNPTLNNQPLSAITNLNEFLAGQSSQPGQQLLSQQVNSYIQTLGLDPASVANITHQQGGTLAQLLSSLKTTATNNNEALKTTADSLEGSNTSGSSTGGGLYSF